MNLVSMVFFAFVIVLLCCYYFVFKKHQWIVLLVASAVFYLYGNWRLVGYILVTMGTQYILAMKLDDINQEIDEEIARNAKTKSDGVEIKNKYVNRKKRLLTVSAVVTIGLLIFVKYINLFIESINSIFGRFGAEAQLNRLNLIIPLGISFYTFQSLGYVIDVYRGKDRAERNFFKLVLFISFFPTIVQGPIERHSYLAKQLYLQHGYDYKRMCFGLQRMLWGYIKKLVIADRALVVVNEVFGNYAVNDYRGFVVFIGVFLAGIRTYADFSGGMDIVIGLCEMLGIELTENFRQPYLSKSISEFWQRWHITLGAWFKNYMFYPISLSKAFNNLTKKLKPKLGKMAKYVPPTIASLIVFTIIGIWHGANWKYLVYGLWNAFFVSSGTFFADLYADIRKKFRIKDADKSWQFVQIIRTIIIVTMGRFFSQADSTQHAFNMIKAMFSQFNPWVFNDGTFYNLGLSAQNFRFLIFSIVVLFAVDVLHERNIHIRETISGYWLPIRWTIYYGALFFVLIFGMYGPGYNASDFIYMHF